MMLRIVEHLTVYSLVVAALWWKLHGQSAGRGVSPVLAAVATALLAALLAADVQWLIAARRERRQAEASARAVIEAERLRRRAYDLCASLRLGFDICENCWAWRPDRATRELDRLRAAVGQFLRVDLGASG